MSTDRTPGPSLRTILIIVALLSGAIFAVYWQTLDHQFVYDDYWYVVNNEHVANGLNIDGVRWSFSLSEKEASYYHPLSWLSHMLDVEIFGLHPAGHHLSNILLHWFNSLLLFWFFWGTTRNTRASAIVALLFAIHPINVESVAWVAERKNLLSTFFGFCAILAYKKYAAAKGPYPYLTVCFFFLLSLLAKPTLAILPAILLIIDYWPLHRFRANGSIPPARLIKLVIEKLPFFFLSLAAVVVASTSLSNYNNMHSSALPLQLRLANALVAPIKYLLKILVPIDHSIFYPFPTSIPAVYWAGSLLLLCIVSFCTILVMRKEPYFFSGWFWFLVSLLPVSGVMQAGLWPSIADRWAYIPGIGIFVIIAWSAEEMYAAAGRVLRPFLLAVGIGIVLFLFAATFSQVKIWRSPLTLFQQALRAAPENYVVNLNYANALLENGMIDQSIQYYEKALSLNKDSSKAHLNLANAFVRQDKFQQAIKHYRTSLQHLPADDPSSPQIHFALGNAYERMHDLKNASIEFSTTIQLKPDFIEAYNALGIVLAEQGNVEKAVALFKKGLQLKPDDPVIRKNLEHCRKLLPKK